MFLLSLSVVGERRVSQRLAGAGRAAVGAAMPGSGTAEAGWRAGQRSEVAGLTTARQVTGRSRSSYVSLFYLVTSLQRRGGR